MNRTIDSIVLVGIIAVVFYCMMVTKDWLEDNFQIAKKETVKMINLLKLTVVFIIQKNWIILDFHL